MSVIRQQSLNRCHGATAGIAVRNIVVWKKLWDIIAKSWIYQKRRQQKYLRRHFELELSVKRDPKQSNQRVRTGRQPLEHLQPCGLKSIKLLLKQGGLDQKRLNLSSGKDIYDFERDGRWESNNHPVIAKPRKFTSKTAENAWAQNGHV